MNIGSQTDATRALETDYEYNGMLILGEFQDEVQAATWDGQEESWTLILDDVALLGNGSCRRVWTIDGDVAYKVNMGGYDGDNLEEWARYQKHHDNMPEGTRLPLMSLYMVEGRAVIAVEVIKFPRQWHDSTTPVLPFSFFDNGSYNYRYAPDGTFIPIDFAC